MTGPGIKGKITDYKLKSRWQAVVPLEFEQREAARFSHLTWDDYCALPGTRTAARWLGISNCKCDVIAHYRLTKLYEAVLIDVREKHPPPPPPKGRR